MLMSTGPIGLSLARGPSDDIAGEQIQDDGQVWPTLPGAQTGDVGHPYPVG